MRITKIDIPKTPEQNDGLEHIKMDKLGKVVLIAGKNGSGKTRILNKIFNTFSSKPKKTRLAQSLRDLQAYQSNLSSYRQSIVHEEGLLQSQTDTNRQSEIQRNIDNYKRTIEQQENAIKNCQYEQNWKMIETDVQSDNYSYVRFVPKRLDLQDCNTFPKSQIISYASTVDNVGVDSLPQGAFAKIQFIQDRWLTQHTNTHKFLSKTKKKQ